MPEIVRPFIIQFFLVLLDRFYQKAVSLKRSHAFLTGNRAACKSVAWESFLFGSFPGKQFFYDSDKVVNSCIYDYLRSQKLSGSLIIAEFCLCSPILARSYCEHRHFFFTRYYSIQGYTLSPNISSNFFNSLPIPSILVGREGHC